MGSRDAKAFLASPEVVAASALKGSIASPDYHRALYSTKVGGTKISFGFESGTNVLFWL
jgi:aconitase A